MSDLQVFVDDDGHDVLVEADQDSGVQVEVTPSFIEVAPTSDLDINVEADVEIVVVDLDVHPEVMIDTPPSGAMGVDIYTGQIGPTGPQGPPGPPGESGLGNYVHHQSVPLNEWVIPHNLGVHPNVTIVDSSGRVVHGELAYLDQNTVVASFSAAFAGTAYLS